MKEVQLLKKNKFYFVENFDSPELPTHFITALILNETIVGLPILPSLAAKLNSELIYTSIAGTASIEGNPMTNEDVAKVAKGEELQEYTQKHNQEIKNLLKAYRYLERFKPTKKPYKLSEKLIRYLHIRVTKDVPGEETIPGKYRTGKVEVGDKAHGGVYKPPSLLKDIELLMSEFIVWINSEKVLDLNPFHRAFLAHYYFCKIHPFGDGNGRTGRLIEAVLLQTANIKYVAREMSNFYYKRVDDYYIAFSKANKLKKDATPFLEFCAEGAVTSLHEIKRTVTHHIRILALKDFFSFLLAHKNITHRQHDLLKLLFDNPTGVTVKDLHNKSPFDILYKTVTVQTARRDLKILAKEGYLFIEDDSQYHMNYHYLDNHF
jgi:Fic family protein